MVTAKEGGPSPAKLVVPVLERSASTPSVPSVKAKDEKPVKVRYETTQ